MKLSIISPYETLYEGEVKLVQLPGQDGLFEILNSHAPIIATITKGSIKLVDINGKEERVKMDGGILEFRENVARVLVM